MSERPWPVQLTEALVGLRPLRRRDSSVWRVLRIRNAEWLRPWDATLPHALPGPREDIPGFSAMVSRMRSEARAGRTWPFALTYNGVLCGQLTVAGIAWGSLRCASIGYWVDERLAGRGVVPTAVAMATDHCFASGLHRVEIAIRPENAPSLRVVEKLGFRSEGIRPLFLHIDGQWRDHQVFALTAEEVPLGLLVAWRARKSSSGDQKAR